MAKKSTKKKASSAYTCPSCRGEIKPTLGTITGISPQKCKCGKFLVAPIWLTALVLGAIFALWYGFLLLSGVILPLLIQILLLPVWGYAGYKLARGIMFRLVVARDLSKG